MVLLPARRRMSGRRSMGLTSLVVRISNPTEPTRFVDREMLVDSGAVFAIVPGAVLRRLGIRPRRRGRVRLPGGAADPPQHRGPRLGGAGRTRGGPGGVWAP